MNTVIIGDVHGRETWKDIVNIEGTDQRYIFVGDYWDSYDVSFNDQRDNYLDILSFKKNNMNNVELLIGNHDFNQYVYNNKCSGYQDTYAPQIRQLLNDHFDLFDVVTTVISEKSEYVVSHAGFTKVWCNEFIHYPSDIVQFVKNINKQWKNGLTKQFFFQTVHNSVIDMYGINPNQGPMWVRPDTLKEYGIRANQIVGHTEGKKIKTKVTDENYEIYFVDSQPEYLTITNEGIIIKTL